MNRLTLSSMLCATLALVIGCAHDPHSPSAAAIDSPSQAGAWKEDFEENLADLSTSGRNDYFILEPGYTLQLEGQDEGVQSTLTVRVLDETREIHGVPTRVVEEREAHGGELVEVSRNFFAFSPQTKNVYYFGEEVDIYKHGRITNHEGAWQHGEAGARYGLMMPGTVRVGDRYYQELAQGVAMDRVEQVSTSETFKCAAGTFENCLKTEETTPLEPKAREYKVYAPGVGLVKDEDFELVSFGKR